MAELDYEFAEKHEARLRADEIRLSDMDMEDNREAFKEAKGQAEYIIPFDGELQINIPLIPGQNDYTVASREVIATLNDYTEIHGRLVVKNADWISLPPDSLQIRLKDKARTKLKFLDDRNISSTRGKEERNYIFNIELEGNQELRRLTGSTLDADLLHNLGKPCYIVPKLQFSLYAMSRSKEREWDSILSDLFPDAEILAEGLEHLAIHLPNKTALNEQK